MQFVNFVTVVGLHQHDTPDALFLALHRVPHRIAFLQRPGVDADKGQLADVGVGHQFERQRRQRLIVARMAFRRLAFLIHALYRRNIQRRRHQLHHRVEHALHAFVFKGAPAEHRLDLPLHRALAQTGDDLRLVQLAGFEVFIHQRVAGLRRRRDHFLPPLAGSRQQIVRDRPVAEGHALGGVIPQDGAHFHQVDDAGEMLFSANGDHNRHRVSLQAVDHHLHHAEEVRAGAVHLVDEGQPRDMVFIRLAPDGLRLGLHPADGVIHHHRAVEHAHGTFHLNGEIHVPRGVDDIDPVRLEAAVHPRPEAAYRRRGNGDPALLLLGHPVGGCRAIVYFTQLMAHPGIKQDALGGGGFTGIDMRGDTDVAITFEGDGSGHDASLVVLTVSLRSE